MHVTTVTATIRYSQGSGKGAWKSLEIGAEALVEPGDKSWQEVQARLYDRLTQQFKQLWARNGTAPHDAQEVPTKPQQPAKAQEPPPRQHWCAEHQTDYKRFEKGGKVWYSHKTTEGEWCREG